MWGIEVVSAVDMVAIVLEGIKANVRTLVIIVIES